MLVQCPSCHTTYRVSDNVVTTPDPTFRCSRCKHVFVLGLKPSSAPPDETTETPPARSRKEQDWELSFSFPPPETHETAPESIEESAGPPMPDETPAPSAEEQQSSFMVPKREESWSITPAPPVGGEPFTIKEEKPLAPIDRPGQRPLEFERKRPDSAPAQQGAAHGPSAESLPDQPISTNPYFILCGCLLFFFSLLTLMHKARPEVTESLLKTIPWVGSSILKNNHLGQGIVLQTVRSRFQKIQGNREVFLVSGVTLNRNPVKVREVRVEGYVLGSNGKVVERHIITVGNAISARIIRDLTLQEISTLQKLSPPKRFEMSPGDSAAFVIVFLKSSAEIKSFSYRVLSAEEA